MKQVVQPISGGQVEVLDVPRPIPGRPTFSWKRSRR